MRITPHLTVGHDAELHRQILKTYPGQAHWAAGGPFCTTCGECRHLGYFRKVTTAAGDTVATKRCKGCAKFYELTGKHGPAVPANAESCRHFERRSD